MCHNIAQALNNMREILFNLPDKLVEYLDSNSYTRDRSGFMAMLIKCWQREVEKSKRETEQTQNNPHLQDSYQ